MTISLSQLARGANVKSAPEMSDAFDAALQANPKLDLANLSPVDKAVLNGWFNRYYGISITQVANLRSTINQPHKHLALDLVAFLKPEVRERAGLSFWFPQKP